MQQVKKHISFPHSGESLASYIARIGAPEQALWLPNDGWTFEDNLPRFITVEGANSIEVVDRKGEGRTVLRLPNRAGAIEVIDILNRELG